ncbi:peptidase C39 family protein [Synechococcus sp. Nb3U1]|uniref:peptidase C39 family protein n=1 Tax=Synechococcus sp. Nb3U1 TaxID=1914529 RepID=UPI001F2539F6|nr:peptidase C39 family protein [Synechococcus sp. Nb3U1]MCF2972417.1 peptidase C39 family protein [Synechococcus sp. Nb3U1]
MPTEPQTYPTYRTGFHRWRSREGQGFRDWSTQGIHINAQGQMQLDPQGLTREEDPDPEFAHSLAGELSAYSLQAGSFYTGGSYWVGEATSPAVPTGFAMVGAIASWNAITPRGTWLELLIRAKVQDRWTKWYHGGVWAADPSTLASHSVKGQRDEDGTLYTDLLVLDDEINGAEAFQVKLRLFTQDPGRSARVDQVAVALSNVPVKPDRLLPGDPARWGQILEVPQCSQMVYPEGGEVWCSPTSLAMVMAYWQQDIGPCEPMVRSSVAGVYDWVYRGHGNWVFNVAHAAEQGLAGVVARLESFAQAEDWIAAGVPVILSFAWAEGDLDGAPIPKSDGHLAVLVGFDANGDPVVNDPAAKTDTEVRRTYRRAQLESLWLEHSGGTVYLIHPPDWPTPKL